MLILHCTKEVDSEARQAAPSWRAEDNQQHGSRGADVRRGRSELSMRLDVAVAWSLVQSLADEATFAGTRRLMKALIILTFFGNYTTLAD